jgi:hypothetical protein
LVGEGFLLQLGQDLLIERTHQVFSAGFGK